ncbi:mitochondrial carrier homolog 2-like [Leptopilina boulardi]|uniref:mitochondrial carrier homolog 2-like n=1 Tax=Leptopilina boulardi TaxID=63433 RepID=UPI0021F57D9D|nr:mitochondrial carrier homolog 2-like [Leptopilina boulardi]
MFFSKEETTWSSATWSSAACRLIVNAASHPIEYAKVLIQIGHEPIAPYPSRTLFGRPALALPNVYKYIKYIKSVDGFTGCYRGLVPKLCSSTVSTMVYEKTAEYIRFKQGTRQVYSEEEDERAEKYIQDFIRALISTTVGIIVSHPLDVIAIRMMAQFVGGETKYIGLMQSLIEIYKENGIAGYFSGLMPRLIAGAAILTIVSSSTYVINKYIITDREMKGFTSSTMMFLAATVAYPFIVVSNCMAVNDCGLVAGMPPQMPIYGNWLDCWSHLSATNQLKRGSSLLWRYYTGPITVLNGKPFPISTANLYMKSVH